MKELCLLFLVAGCMGQMPVGPGGPTMPQGSMQGNMGSMPTGLPPAPTMMPAAVPTVAQPEDNNGNGGTGGTPSPLAPSGPNGPPNVSRPCRRYDINCVRYFFKDHSHCKPAHGKVPEPVFRAISNQFYPAFNLTVTDVNALYTGFNTGRVQDMYVNRETDKVVLTIDIRNLTKSSRDVFIRYHRRAREPIITYGYLSFTYPSLIVTVTIPQVNDLRMDKSDSFAYANVPAVLDIDPKLGESSDPVVARSFGLAIADLNTITTENLLTESSYFAAVYIQNVICDFGLKLI